MVGGWWLVVVVLVLILVLVLVVVVVGVGVGVGVVVVAAAAVAVAVAVAVVVVLLLLLVVVLVLVLVLLLWLWLWLWSSSSSSLSSSSVVVVVVLFFLDALPLLVSRGRRIYCTVLACVAIECFVLSLLVSNQNRSWHPFIDATKVAHPKAGGVPGWGWAKQRCFKLLPCTHPQSMLGMGSAEATPCGRQRSNLQPLSHMSHMSAQHDVEILQTVYKVAENGML